MSVLLTSKLRSVPKKIFQNLAVQTFYWLFFACWTLGYAAVLYWYAGYPLMLSAEDSLIHNLPIALTGILVSFMLGYFLPGRSNYFYVVVNTLVLTALNAWISYWFSQLLLESTPALWAQYLESVPYRTGITLLILGSITLNSLLWYHMQEQQSLIQRSRDGEQMAREAELFKLRQQLQPHFLFNSLNSINALISIDPSEARDMVIKLSNFLRGTIKKDEQALVKLEEEWQNLMLYLDIERVRFGHRLQLKDALHESAAGSMLPPLLLQPIVENAVKYGVYGTTGDVLITVAAEVKDHYLEITISNPFDATAQLTERGTGFGLKSIERRLFLLYASQSLLQTRTEENTFVTTLKIPQAHV